MDEIAPEYDVVVLGTGRYAPPLSMYTQAHLSVRLDRMCTLWVNIAFTTECVLCADWMCRVMSVKGKKVLHIDRNDHYGGYVFDMEMRFMLDSSLILQRSSLGQHRICGLNMAGNIIIY